MKLLLLLLWLALLATQAQAQRPAPPKPAPTIGLTDDPLYHCFGCRFPVYKDGGAKGMLNSIGKNMRYPHHLTTAGRVLVEYTVDTTGKVRNARIKQGFQPEADSAALRAVRALGDFVPAMNEQGRPLTVKQTIPVWFSPK
ncbi:energy transducer TonB family protein [Hymenobacter cellulosilyticus]|uniref:Energy transducer TonB n=1 Tax=Hymenobacter cellulosilyticus TaxID=2932248 RepID=A0A8T9QB41_9BACT|nr:energy transducer TonB [Hymenobacter cellulosilyticus]UOQ73030.1 energy transducer TonB [Hymenobacter cellulosilyticus]